MNPLFITCSDASTKSASTTAPYLLSQDWILLENASKLSLINFGYGVTSGKLPGDLAEISRCGIWSGNFTVKNSFQVSILLSGFLATALRYIGNSKPQAAQQQLDYAPSLFFGLHAQEPDHITRLRRGLSTSLHQSFAGRIATKRGQDQSIYMKPTTPTKLPLRSIFVLIFSLLYAHIPEESPHNTPWYCTTLVGGARWCNAKRHCTPPVLITARAPAPHTS